MEIKEIEKAQGPAEAEKALVELLRQGEQSHLAFLALAKLLMKQQKFDDAIRSATKAKALAPLEADCSIVLGLISLKSKQVDQAAEAFADAIRLDPYSTKANLGAAAVKMEIGQLEEAAEICHRIQDMDPSFEQAHELLARIRMKQGEKDAAADELKGVVARNPDNKKALRAYIRLMRQENRGDEVLELLEADASASPEDARKADRLARVAASVGRSDIAAQNYEKMAEKGSLRVSDKVRYIVALIQADELVKARVMIDQLGKQRVMKPVAAKLLGDMALKQGDPASAVKQYRLACQAARVPMLDQAQATEADSELTLAEAWRAHAQEEILAAVKQRRASAA